MDLASAQQGHQFLHHRLLPRAWVVHRLGLHGNERAVDVAEAGVRARGFCLGPVGDVARGHPIDTGGIREYRRFRVVFVGVGDARRTVRWAGFASGEPQWILIANVHPLESGSKLGRGTVQVHGVQASEFLLHRSAIADLVGMLGLCTFQPGLIPNFPRDEKLWLVLAIECQIDVGKVVEWERGETVLPHVHPGGDVRGFVIPATHGTVADGEDIVPRPGEFAHLLGRHAPERVEVAVDLVEEVFHDHSLPVGGPAEPFVEAWWWVATPSFTVGGSGFVDCVAALREEVVVLGICLGDQIIDGMWGRRDLWSSFC